MPPSDGLMEEVGTYKISERDWESRKNRLCRSKKMEGGLSPTQAQDGGGDS